MLSLISVVALICCASLSLRRIIKTSFTFGYLIILSLQTLPTPSVELVMSDQTETESVSHSAILAIGMHAFVH